MIRICIDASDYQIVSAYSLQSVYDEWTKEVVLNDVRHPALKVLDERRRNGEPSWDSKNHGLKTSIQKRRKLVEYVQKVALEKHGGVGEEAAKEAIKNIEKEMETSHGQHWSLNSLYLNINKYGCAKRAKQKPEG